VRTVGVPRETLFWRMHGPQPKVGTPEPDEDEMAPSGDETVVIGEEQGAPGRMGGHGGPRTLYFANHLRGPKGSGGTRSWHQARRLGKSGQVVVIVPRIDPLTEEPVMPPRFEPDEVVRVVVAYSGKPRRNSIVGRVFYALSCIVGQMKAGWRESEVDVVCAMAAPITSALVPVLLSAIWGVPLVLDVRDIPSDTAQEIGYLRSRLVLGGLRWLERLVFRRAAAAAVVSREMIPFIVSRGASVEDTVWLPIGYDGFPDPPAATVSRVRQSLQGAFQGEVATLALYTGTLGHITDVQAILDVAKELRSRSDIGFVIAGSGQKLEEYRARVRTEGTNVHFLGRITKERVHAVCRACDIALFPLRGGPAAGAMLGNKIFDYMGAGRCVVYAGPDGAVSRLIRESRCGVVVDEREVRTLAAEVESLADDAVARQAAGRRGREFVMSHMTATQSADGLASLIERVLDRSANADRRSPTRRPA